LLLLLVVIIIIIFFLSWRAVSFFLCILYNVKRVKELLSKISSLNTISCLRWWSGWGRSVNLFRFSQVKTAAQRVVPMYICYKLFEGKSVFNISKRYFSVQYSLLWYIIIDCNCSIPSHLPPLIVKLTTKLLLNVPHNIQEIISVGV